MNSVINWPALVSQLLDILLALLLAPAYSGWLTCCRARLQQRSAPSLWQPYWNLGKLMLKEPVIADRATALFHLVPYLVFAALTLAAGIVPLLTSQLILAPMADAIALVGLFSLVRVFMALAAMDTGTAFGSLGARREMLMGFLAEPALLSVFFTVALMTSSTSLATIVQTLLHRPFEIYPSLAFAGVAFVMVFLAENGRIPVDNPTTHLELTMIHEAMLLEYSGRHLALMEWGQSLKLLVYTAIGCALFLPWGLAESPSVATLALAFLLLLLKLLLAGVAIAVLETASAKLRIFRVPEYLGMAFIFGVLGMFVHVLLET